MTGTVARGVGERQRGACAGRGRGREAGGARARVTSEDAPVVRTRARETLRADAPRATLARPRHRHFDVVKKVRAREKGPRARASAEARGVTSARLRAETRAARRKGDNAREDGLAGRRAERARPPRVRRAARGKGRQSADGGRRADLGSRGAYLLLSRRARSEGASSRFSVPVGARSRCSLGPSRVCSARAGVPLRARGRARKS